MIGKGSFRVIEVRNPASACCPEALLVCGLRTLGVPLIKPAAIFREKIAGEVVEVWQWVLADTAADGVPTADLVKNWNSLEWLALHPAHELAIVRATLLNMGAVAEELRTTIPRAIVRDGDNCAIIPANASPAKRAHLLAQLAGTIPITAKFTEPTAAATV